MGEISVKIIADSCSSVSGERITTFELEYPRFIHAELMTHRVFSRNAMSSRAVPVKKMIEQVREDPAMPTHWGKNQPGMQAKEELQGNSLVSVRGMWEDAAKEAAYIANKMDICKAHKQLVNRILEPFQRMKTVVTSTEWDNFFWLRAHPDAQPEIKILAEKMLKAMDLAEQELNIISLQPGDWHTPYFGDGYWLKGCGIPLEEALWISSSCCAQVSYRVLNDSLEKAKDIFKKLIESKPCHASPTEHQATPIPRFSPTDHLRGNVWDVEGITHEDRDGNLWSGNFKGWIQHRQLIPDNVCNEYKKFKE